MTRRVPHLVYFAARRVDDGWDVKIGITVDLEQRMKIIKGDLIFAIPCTKPTARELEFELQKTFATSRYKGTEWFAKNDALWMLITNVLKLGYWPWDHTPIIRGANW